MSWPLAWEPPCNSSTVPSPYASDTPATCAAFTFEIAKDPHNVANAAIAKAKPKGAGCIAVNPDQIFALAVINDDVCVNVSIANWAFCAFCFSLIALSWFFFAKSNSFCAVVTSLAYPAFRASISASNVRCAASTWAFAALTAASAAAFQESTNDPMDSFTESMAVFNASCCSESKPIPNNSYILLYGNFLDSFSMAAIVFSIVFRSCSVIFKPAAASNSNIFCNRSFSCCNWNWVFWRSLVSNKANSDAPNCCCASNNANARLDVNSVVCFNMMASHFLLMSASFCRTSAFNWAFCANSMSRCFFNNSIDKSTCSWDPSRVASNCN